MKSYNICFTHYRRFRMRLNIKLASVLTVLMLLAMGNTGAAAQLVTTDFPRSPRPAEATEKQTHEFVGMWVTEDGYIRHELLDNGRYDEARGDRDSAWQGRYRVTGDIIQYWDDTGFYADGQFRDGVLYHGGYIFYRGE